MRHKARSERKPVCADQRHTPQGPLSIPFTVPKIFSLFFFFLLPPPLVCLLNRMGRLGNLEDFLKVVTNKKIKIEMTSHEQVSQGNKVTELSISGG